MVLVNSLQFYIQNGVDRESGEWFDSATPESVAEFPAANWDVRIPAQGLWANRT